MTAPAPAPLPNGSSNNIAAPVPAPAPPPVSFVESTQNLNPSNVSNSKSKTSKNKKKKKKKKKSAAKKWKTVEVPENHSKNNKKNGRPRPAMNFLASIQKRRKKVVKKPVYIPMFEWHQQLLNLGHKIEALSNLSQQSKTNDNDNDNDDDDEKSNTNANVNTSTDTNTANVTQTQTQIETQTETTDSATNTTTTTTKYVSITAVSDLHMGHEKLTMPAADILVVSGDFTNNGTIAECKLFAEWLRKLRYDRKLYKHIILICGNHEGYTYDSTDASILNNTRVSKAKRQHARTNHDFSAYIDYLRDEIFVVDAQPICTAVLYDSSVTVENIKFFGSSWTPHLPCVRQQRSVAQIAQLRNHGFYSNYETIGEQFSRIPLDTNYLVTHTPPLHILDVNNYGCHHLLYHVSKLKELRVHQFGHCHNGYGWKLVLKKEFTMQIDRQQHIHNVNVNGNVDDNNTADAVDADDGLPRCTKKFMQYSDIERIGTRIELDAIDVKSDAILFINAANAANIDMNLTVAPSADDSFEQPMHFRIPV